jgi:hypothetical protein
MADDTIWATLVEHFAVAQIEGVSIHVFTQSPRAFDWVGSFEPTHASGEARANRRPIYLLYDGVSPEIRPHRLEGSV